jgi:hypothetical protein
MSLAADCRVSCGMRQYVVLSVAMIRPIIRRFVKDYLIVAYNPQVGLYARQWRQRLNKTCYEDQ